MKKIFVSACHIGLVFSLCFVFLPTAIGSPTVRHTTPMAAQQGQEVSVILEGNRLQKIEQVLFYDEGITFAGYEPVSEVRHTQYDKMEPKAEGAAARLTFQVAKNCRLGKHYFRVRTDETLSEIQSLWISSNPCVEESQPFSDTSEKTNGDFDNAQSVELGTSVYGYSRSYNLQDHDFFKVELEKGQRLTVEMWSDCLNYNGTSDFAVAVHGPDQQPLAFSDNTELARRDPWLSIEAPKAGTYYVDIHKSMEAENAVWHYIAHITTGKRPALTYPLGGPAGEELSVKLLGGGADGDTAKISLPKDPGAFEAALIEHRFSEAILPNLIHAAAYPNVMEDGSSHFSPESAQVYKGDLPVAFNGIIKDEGQLDWFRFSAKNGERFRVRSLSARLGSPLDPVITIQPAPGTESKIDLTVDDSKFNMHDLADNKNLAHSMKMDPVTIFEADVDGDYLIGISDSQYLASPNHVYRIVFEPITDRTFIRVTRDYREAASKREAFTVPRGSTIERTMEFPRIMGNLYNGEVEVIAKNLPAGVTMSCPPVKVGQRFQIVFTAKKDAKPWAGFIDLKLQPKESADDFIGEFLYHRVADGGRGGYGDSFYLSRKCPFAIVEPAPFSVKVLDPGIPLMKNSSLEVEAEITRRVGFSGPVRLTGYWTPNGVVAGAPVDIPADQSKAKFSISANSSAALGKFPFTLTLQQALDNTKDARGERNNTFGTGYHYVASPPVNIRVDEPYLELSFERAAIEQGAVGELVAKIKHLRPMPGPAKANLLLLPRGVESKGDVTIQPDATEVRFPVQVTKECLVGPYQNITCELSVKDGDKLISQTSGKGVLRVDEGSN